jgi:hypothetical protein
MLSGAYPELRILAFHPSIRTRPHVVFSKNRAVPLIARKFAAELKETMDDLIAGSAGMLKRPEARRSATVVA